MPWWGGLGRETIQQLYARHPGLTFDDIAIAAMRHPDYAAEFARLRAQVVEFDSTWALPDSSVLGLGHLRPEEFPRVSVPVENAAAFRDLVVAVMLREDAAPADGGSSGRDPLPVQETARVVEMREFQRLPWQEIVKRVSLSHRKVFYINTALKHGDLGWNHAAGHLTFGPETRNTSAGIVLPRR